jgi:hypothetical protein
VSQETQRVSWQPCSAKQNNTNLRMEEEKQEENGEMICQSTVFLSLLCALCSCTVKKRSHNVEMLRYFVQFIPLYY